jgi:hypothetical protein
MSTAQSKGKGSAAKKRTDPDNPKSRQERTGAKKRTDPDNPKSRKKV